MALPLEIMENIILLTGSWNFDLRCVSKSFYQLFLSFKRRILKSLHTSIGNFKIEKSSRHAIYITACMSPDPLHFYKKGTTEEWECFWATILSNNLLIYQKIYWI